MRLTTQKEAVALIMDENQKCPADTYNALASRSTTVVTVGDRGQELYPLVPQDRDQSVLKVHTFANRARPSSAAELFVSTAAGYSWRTRHLCGVPRFGKPLAEHLARGHPGLCPRLRASVGFGKSTGGSHIWYKAPRGTWHNLG